MVNVKQLGLLYNIICISSLIFVSLKTLNNKRANNREFVLINTNSYTWCADFNTTVEKKTIAFIE